MTSERDAETPVAAGLHKLGVTSWSRTISDSRLGNLMH